MLWLVINLNYLTSWPNLQLKIDGLTQDCRKTHWGYYMLALSHWEGPIISRDTGTFLAYNLRPYTFVEDPALVKVIETLESSNKMPNLPHSQSTVWTTYAWSGPGRKTMSFITTTVHFISSNWSLADRVPENVHIPESHKSLGEALYMITQKLVTIRPQAIDTAITTTHQSCHWL